MTTLQFAEELQRLTKMLGDYPDKDDCLIIIAAIEILINEVDNNGIQEIL